MLDVKTVAITYFVTSLMLTVVMTVLWLQNRKQFNGILFFAACVALQTTGFLLIASQKVIHPFFSILIANTLIALAPFLLYLGLERFFDYRHSQRRNYIILAVFIGFYTYFTHIRPDVGTRIGLISIVVAVMFLQISWFMLHRIDSRFKPITRAAGILFLLFSLVQIYRLTLTFFIPAGGDYLSIHASDTTAQIINQVLAIAMVFSLVLMINNRSLQVIREKEDLLVSSRVEMEIGNREMAELKRADEMLRDSEEKYKRLIDNIPDIIFTIDLEGKITFVSGRTKEILGYEITEAINMNILDFIPEEDRQRAIENVQKGMTGEKIKHLQLTMIKKSGERLFFECSFSRVYKDGVLVGAQGTAADITERKRAEEALKESEDRYRTLFEDATDGMALADAETGILMDCNQRLCQMVERDKQELVGQAHNILHLPDDLIEGRSPTFQKHRAENPEDALEDRLIARSGQLTPVEIRAAKIRINNRDCMLGIFRDITERKQSLIVLQEALVGTVQAMATVVESRDPYTAGHQRRVAELAQAIASEMNLPANQIEGIQMAAIIHDLGKIAVPAEILSKPKKLTAIEYGLIKSHPQDGYDMLKDINFPWPIAKIILEHHENLDGSGYPNGLVGENILLESKIIAVADVVEAMASHRPYRPALGIDIALKEIETNKGTLYDEDVADVCLRLFREKGFQFDGN